MSSPAQAYEDVIWEDYKADIIELLDQYDEDFAACFPERPADFRASGDISTLGERINELDEATWYHRHLGESFGVTLGEIVFSYKPADEHYYITVVYRYDSQNENFSIFGGNFYGDMGGYAFGWTAAIPEGVAEKSLKEVDICAGETPGFPFLASISALFIMLAMIRFTRRR